MIANLALHWLGVALEYIVAGVLVAGGGYLEFVIGPAPFGIPALGSPFRFLGRLALVAGIALGAITYGKSLGLKACAADARVASLQAENARLKLSAALQSVASASALSSMQTLARQKDDLQNQVADMADKARGLDACRRATGDDDRRMRAILQGHAPAR